jgi:hypothetical protein
MKINQLNGFVFDSESGVLGAVAGVDFIKQTVTILVDEDETVVAKLDNVSFLEMIGTIGSVGVIDGDVIVTKENEFYELVAVGVDEVQLFLLDKKFQRIETGDIIKRTDLNILAPHVKLVGNIHQLESIPAVEFNVIVVRKQDKDGIKFFYACNNAEKEEVDLIKVVFVGHHLLKEETYERTTVSHDEYLELIENGSFVETSPQALQNYVTGLMYGHNNQHLDTIEDEEEDFLGDSEDYEVEDEDRCEDCGECVEDCDCDW